MRHLRNLGFIPIAAGSLGHQGLTSTFKNMALTTTMEIDHSGGGAKEEPAHWFVIVTERRGGSNHKTYTFQKNEGVWGILGGGGDTGVYGREGGIKVKCGQSPPASMQPAVVCLGRKCPWRLL